MSVRESTTLPLTVTSKHPFLGFSGLISMLTPGLLALTRVSSLEARVLNAPHDLHASMTTPEEPDLAAAAGLATSFFAMGDLVVFFFGALYAQRTSRTAVDVAPLPLSEAPVDSRRRGACAPGAVATPLPRSSDTIRLRDRTYAPRARSSRYL